MSITLTLVPLAVAVGVSLTAGSTTVLTQHRETPEKKLPPLETAFQDAGLLHKTLTQHGLQVQSTNENELIVRSPSGTLRYIRKDRTEPFLLELEGVADMDWLTACVDQLEHEYGRNVQTFTYHKVMESLQEHGMTVDGEEILEDDSILLTLKL